MNDLTSLIIKYEETDEMGLEETVSFFQRLIDTGLAWNLQGHYGRTANALIEEGLCSLNRKEAQDVGPRDH